MYNWHDYDDYDFVELSPSINVGFFKQALTISSGGVSGGSEVRTCGDQFGVSVCSEVMTGVGLRRFHSISHFARSAT